MADSVTGSSSSATTVAAGGTPGEIETAGDQDWYRIPMTSGVTYTIRVAATGATASTFDPLILGIFDTNDNYFTGFNNDGLISGPYRHDAMTTYSRPVTTPATTVDYWVAVTGDTRTTGFYDISVSTSSITTDSVTADTATTGVVTAGGAAVAGTIDNATDVDWFKVTLTAGATYTIRVRGLTAGAGTLVDPTLTGVYTSSGAYITNTYVDDLDTRDAALTMTAPYTGTYFIAADGWSTYTGTYTVDVSGAALSDVPGNTSSTATLAIGSSTTAYMEQPYDHDWYKVSLTAGTTYQFTLSGNGANNTPVMHGVFSATGSYLGAYAAGILGSQTSAASTIFTPSVSGNYFIDAFSVYEGTYTLSAAQVANDTPANTTTTATVAVDGSVVGEIGGATDIDWYKVTLVGDATYVIKMQGKQSGFGTLEDTIISGIYDSTGKVVDNTFSDDTDGNEASLTFRPATSGTYYIAADGYASYTGTYKLSVTSVAGDVPQTKASLATVTLNTPTTVTIDDASDTDWYGINLTANTTYGIRLQGAPTKRGTLSDPVLVGVYDSAGNLVPDTFVDDARNLLNAYLSFTPTASGKYYIAADGYDRFTGTVRLAVTTDNIGITNGTSGTLTPGTAAEGTIDAANDTDRYAVTLDANSTYYIRMQGFQNRNGDLSDPHISGIFNSGGTTVGPTEIKDAVGADVVVGTDSWYKVAVGASSVTYYVDTTGNAGTDGSFLLTADKDIAGSQSTTTTLAVGSSLVGMIDEGADTDWYSISLLANTSYAIKMAGTQDGNGTLVDPYLNGLRVSTTPTTIIGGTSGTTIDNNAGRDSVVRFIPGANTTYYINAQSSGATFGTYVISLSTEVGNTSATAGAVTVGGSVNGMIEDTADIDWFRVHLLANTSYLVKMLGVETGVGTLDDPLIPEIRNSSGTAMTNEVITAVGMDAYVRWVPGSEADYFIETQGGGTDYGTFVLSVETEVGGTAATAGTLTIGGSVNGRIDDGTDADWYKISVTNNNGYLFKMLGSDTGAGTLIDTNIPAIRDASGNAQTTNFTATAVGSDTYVYWTPTANGDFYIDAQGAGKTGSFVLTGQTEVGTTALSATPVTVGGSATGTIDTAGDSDYFKFAHSGSTGYLIRMTGGTLSTPTLAGVLNTSNVAQSGAVITTSGADSLMRWAPTSSTAADFLIDAEGNGSIGTYTISVQTEAGGATTNAWTLNIGSSVSAAIDDTTDTDFYKVTLVNTTSYIFRMSGVSSNAGTLADPRIFDIRDASNVQVTTEVASAFGTDSIVRFAPGTGGTFYVDAQGSGGIGTYVLTAQTEAGSTFTNSQAITLGTSVFGAIDDGADTDRYYLTLTGGTRYRVRAEGADNSGGALTLIDPYINGIRLGTTSTAIANTTQDGGGTGRDAYVIFTPGSTGTYSIDVDNGVSNATAIGTYKLTVELWP